jgi:hypothetical protein
MVYLQENSVKLASKPLSVGMDIGVVDDEESFGNYRKYNTKNKRTELEPFVN